jgi:ketosteroid isomerase-like protein
MLRKTFLTGLLLAASMTLALGAGAEDEIKAAEKTWTQAVVKRDQAALGRLLHDQLIYAHSTGIVESKSEYLGKLSAGTQRYDGIDYEAMTVKVHGDSAVVQGTVRMRGATKGEPFDNRLMVLHVWVKSGRSWQLAAHQTTRLP